MNHTPRTTRSAFTLMELMVVVVLLALLAALAIPRLIGAETRRFSLAVDQLADLMTMFAQRDNLGEIPVAIWHNADRHQLELLVLEKDDTQPDAPADWRIDRFVSPVVLPANVQLIGARVDGDEFSDPGWSITSSPGQDRPTIEITLLSGERNTTLVLAPSGVAPTRIDAGSPERAMRTSIDLDASGRSRENW